MKAILIKVDFETGKRTGCCHKDKTLVCPQGWQNMDAGLEIRLVTNGDVERFRDNPDLVILEGEDVIDAAVRRHMPPGGRRRFRIYSEAILGMSLQQREIRFDPEPVENPELLLERLYDEGVQGILMTKTPVPMSAARAAAAWVLRQKEEGDAPDAIH